MTDPAPSPAFKIPDPAAFAQNMARALEIATAISSRMSERSETLQADAASQMLPMEQVTQTLGAVAKAYSSDPQKIMTAQMALWSSYTELWQGSWQRWLGGTSPALAEPARSDRRFRDTDWQDNAVFDFIKQFYLISSRWAVDLVQNADGLDEHTRMKARFYVEQIANALSPTNFMMTNPEVLRATLQSNGANIVEGMRHFERDLEAGGGRLQIRQVDGSGFEVGRNIATTPGRVVFRNDIFELIQYGARTETVRSIPLVIFPPWINKYYVLDLNEKKSFVRWTIDQGQTVLIVSWRNPDDSINPKTFSDYVTDGFMAAVQAAIDATGSPSVNVAGYCVGGTLSLCGVALMASRNDTRVNSVTLLTTQVDFTEAGDLRVYVDQEQVGWIEDRMAGSGYLPGRRMADAFNLLRSNDLIWSYMINNYMLGKDPMAFDLLYWNADSTRMPAAVHSYYLRECYLLNNLAEGKMVVDGVALDLKTITIPAYNFAAREDHIAPAVSVYKVARFLGGPTRFVLGGAGHVAGVVNPPVSGKYQYWTGGDSASQEAATLEDWMKGATEHGGSWWLDWCDWIDAHSGAMVPARTPGDGALVALEDAPGLYVLAKDT